jgi:hypothetical protein
VVDPTKRLVARELEAR